MSKKKHKKEEPKKIDDKKVAELDEKLHDGEVVEPETVEDGLRNIYELDDEKKKVDMSKLEVVAQPVVRRILIAVLLVLIAIAAGLAGALLLNNPLDNSRSGALTFDIDMGEEDIIGGRETTFEIPYRNAGGVPLAELEVTLHAPDSFIVTETNPEPVDTNPLTWTVGSLNPKDEGKIEVTGTFYNTPGTAATLQTVTRYVPSNFSSPFEAIESESVLIEESILAVSIDGPDRSVPGETQEYTIVVEHQEEEPVANTELRLELPQGLTIDSSDHEPSTEGSASWTIGELTKDEPYTLVVQGSFASDVAGDQELKAIAGAVLDDEFLPQAEDTFVSDVIASDFALSLVVNGDTGDSIVLPGDDILVNLSLDNRGEEAAEDITIELFVDNGLDRVDLANRAGIPNGDVYGNKINWDYTDMSRLDSLHGSESASIDLAIPTRDAGSTTITLRAEAVITRLGGIDLRQELESSSITVRVASDLSANASARYWDSNGATLGSGPMPPQVGHETTYRVTWTVANALNDVTDLVMVAPIPSDASWGGLVQVTDGSVIHDTVGKRVRWAVGDLAAGASPPIAVFDMKANPSSADVGSFLDLLGTATVTAIDTETNASVSSSASALTSELPDDPLADNKGIVVE